MIKFICLLAFTPLNTRFASVIRFDFPSGVASETRSFPLPRFEQVEFQQFVHSSDLSMLRIHNDVVVVWTPGSFLVGALKSDSIVTVKQPVSHRRFVHFHV